MAFNIAQIKDRAREIQGRNISEQEAQQIMNATSGGDEGQVINLLRGGGGVSAPSGTTGDFIKALVDPILKELGNFEQRVKDFGVEGPFAFDEVQAREAATQEVNPYYQEVLDDYLSGVNLQRRQGGEEEQRLLRNLTREKEFEIGDLRQRIEDAISTTERGFETRGLYESGIRRREAGRQEALGKIGERRVGEVFGEEEERIRGGQRQLQERLNLEQQLKRREIGRERFRDIETIIGQKEAEAKKQTEFERWQTTALPFVERSEEAIRRLLQFA